MSFGQQIITQLINGFGDMVSAIFTNLATLFIIPVLTRFSEAIFGAAGGG